jgi:hypothetical protein
MTRPAGIFVLLLVFATVAAGAAPPRTTVSPCTTSELVVWSSGPGDAGVGNVYVTLGFTNQSGHACTLSGYPGVSALDIQGRALGSPASRDRSTVTTHRLADGATVRSRVRIAQARNFPSARCRVQPAAGLRVYPPGQTTSKVVPIPFAACSRPGTAYLSVRPLA